MGKVITVIAIAAVAGIAGLVIKNRRLA